MDVTSYFNNREINYIDIMTIKELYKINNLDVIELETENDIRLKISFSYLDRDYIIYFPYNRILPSNLTSDAYLIPYPPYSEKLLGYYRNDIIIPTYIKHRGPKYFYSLFSIESKDILEVEINGTINYDLENYIEMIQTPFNDFGILYHTPVKLKWILSENNINLETFRKFYLKFLNPHLDEETMELCDHVIELNNEQLNSIIISDIMKKILDIKNIATA